jgi:hypothetical protein
VHHSGSVIECFGHEFVLEKADEYAIKYMVSHPDQFPHSNLPHILKNIEPFKAQLPAASANTISTVQQFESAIKQAVPSIPVHALAIVSHSFLTANKTIDYEKFLASLS